MKEFKIYETNIVDSVVKHIRAKSYLDNLE